MSATPRTALAFTAVTTVGGLLPADMLLRIAEARDLPGATSADYGLPASVPVHDEAERAWEYLKPLWRDLRAVLPADPTTGAPAADPTGRAGTDWLAQLFRKLDFGALTEVGPDGITTDSDPDTRFPVSHRHGPALIHLIPWNQDLDRRPAPGRLPAQSMLQDCLNRVEAHLWAVLANGRRLRLLRDSSSFATAAYVEFDLEAIFDGELFSEFVLLYRVLHASRFTVAEGTAPSGCWLEKWRTVSIESGSRALDHFRDGVQKALTVLGTGFLSHPHNSRLRERLDVHAFQTALLRLVYRMIFLFVAEDRGALLDPGADERTRERFTRYFSTARLRRHALRRLGTAHDDRYRALELLIEALGREEGRPELGLKGLGGLFDHTSADEPLRDARLSNRHLFEAVKHLARVRDAGSARWRPVDYLHMGAEELGSVYEALLELVPKHSAADRTFELVDRIGNDRKKTGSYYTPSALTETLLDSTLDPVMDDAVKRGERRASAEGRPDPADAIVEELLSLTVCDPACGSGHFLVAAARRIAKRVAAVRERNPEPTAEAVRHALREVVARCVYGVDLNPMAVELAKVSLWLEAMEPGRPLGFLDSHIKHGNGLIGATPALMRQGIPDKAFKAAEGDDAAWARSLLTRNALERAGQDGLFEIGTETRVANVSFARGLRRITASPADSLTDVRRKKAAYRDWSTSAEYLHALHLADAWCAAFVWVKREDAPPAITHKVFRELREPGSDAAPRSTHDEIARLRDQYAFFHWHLEFPEVFTVPEEDDPSAGRGEVDPATGWTGGFSCVVGNPPWDKVDFEDKKYFSVVAPEIAEIAGTARRTRIAEWERENPEGGKRYREARRTVKGTFHFAGDSGVFPLCAEGLTVKGVTMIQTDQLFAERMANLVAPGGRFGLILPTAIATGAGAQHLFADFTRRGALASLYDFENRRPRSALLPKGGKWFENVHSSYKFCLLSLTGRGTQAEASRIGFFLSDVADLEDPGRVFTLDPEDLARINPNTGTLPVFRTQRDADITAGVYRRVPVLYEERRSNGNPWQVTFKATFFHMTDDSDLFRSRERLEAEGWELRGNVFERGKERLLPLYEGKMAHLFDHRWNSYTGTGNEDRRRIGALEKADPAACAVPRYWILEDGPIPTVRRGREVKERGVGERLAELHWTRDWLLGWRDVCRTTDERTAIPAFLPRTAVGHTYPLMLPQVAPPLVAALVAAQSSLVFDFVSRQKISDAHMKLFIWKQLPVPTPTSLEPHLPFLLPRVLELVYTAYDMTPLARDLGDEGEPFRWDEDRRARLRAELDAYFFHLYGISHEDTEHILESFQSESGGLKNNEIARFGEYRTRRLVLAEYDRMAAAGLSLKTPLAEGGSGAYRSLLIPPPGQGPRHPARQEG
ncbi:Type I restriction-modification system methyltransferase subunit [Marinactinospora thermotolerans DSM 45154]|uniref:site-specific DNA-methyltransferase (adenine-specific) n=1 Tax=Marinactinospora thermotolerans DSM 45154 TaxID=1122192 RepID=A0A1T4T4P6_9ACTN|nr:DNA methyltransferase [Marinactinospora thermotolerans]SKA35367.1 Type I restriction-modification system methyltransferase subunit [Marinactinospora thermotolerans DSM 45154]